MAVKLITGVPGSGKTTWCLNHCSHDKIIHTDDIYNGNLFGIPLHIRESYGSNNIVNGLNVLIDLLDKEEETYYIEGLHIVNFVGFSLLDRCIHKIFIIDPSIALNRVTDRYKKDNNSPTVSKIGMLHYHNIMLKLAEIYPDKVEYIN